MKKPYSRTRKILGWILFLPVSTLAFWLVFWAATLIPGFSTLGVAAGAGTAASLLAGWAVGPQSRVAMALVAVATLLASLLGAAIGSPLAILGWAIGLAAVAIVSAKKGWRTRPDLRWALFLPAALATGMLAFLILFFLAEAFGGTSSLRFHIVAVLAFAISVYVAGAMAPSRQAIVILLIAPVSYLVAFATSEDSHSSGMLWSWAGGTAVGGFLALRTARGAREPWRRAGESNRQRYKGTAPYQDLEIDRNTFFGRDRESRQLLSLVLAERLVVLFAKSGMGKSSLINAGLVEPLRRQGFFPMVVRLNDPRQEPLQTLLDGVRRAAVEAHVDLAGGDETSAWRFFKTAEFWSESDDLLRPVLILDQFEELFTLHAPEARRGFIGQLAELVRGRAPAGRVGEGSPPVDAAAPDLTIVIALREDFLANLQDLAEEIPAILHNRFRLGPLSPKDARDAIVEPARVAGEVFETGRFSYEEAAVERMIAFLVKRQTGSKTVESDEVEPVQLQLICHYLEETVRARQAAQGGEVEIQISEADLGGEDQMRQVLEGFYDRTIAAIPFRGKARAVRRLCEQRLISGGGRRLTEDQEEIERRYKISGELLRQLVDARLLRAEPRLGGTFYELSHDRLVEPILHSRNKRASQTLRTALAAIPLFLTVSLSLGWRQFDRLHHRQLAEAALFEADSVQVIRSTPDLIREHQYDLAKLRQKAQPILNPSAFVLFTRPDDASVWRARQGDHEQAWFVVDYIKQSYGQFMRPKQKDAGVFLGALLAILDYARENTGDPAVCPAVNTLRQRILEEHRKESGCGVEAGPSVGISESLVTTEEYGNCFGTKREEPRLPDFLKGRPEKTPEKQAEKTPAHITWYEAVAYAAIWKGELLSVEELKRAGGDPEKEWCKDTDWNRRTKVDNRPFRVRRRNPAAPRDCRN